MEEGCFSCKNLSCSSLELYWDDKNKEENAHNSFEYKLYQKEGSDGVITDAFYFEKIYKGKDNKYEVIDLKPNKYYTFKLKIIRQEKTISEKIITIKTLKAPIAILSERSVKIANGESINYTNILSGTEKGIISNCSRFLFDKNNYNIIKGNFEYIKIKLTHEVDSNIYYISFDIKSENINIFFQNFLEKKEKDVIIPSFFTMKHLPTKLIFNLLEKGPVIFTGKRMGGVIASSLAFYLLFIGKANNMNYGNTFIKNEKNCIGVVTFGSPSFLTNLTAGDKMKEFTPYFINIKEEFDFIPGIIDFINKDQLSKDAFTIFNKLELDINDISFLNKFCIKINFTEENVESDIKKLRNIPFGKYFKFRTSDSNFSLNLINESTFPDFYHLQTFYTKKSTSNLKLYENLSSKIIFNKEALQFLLNQEYELEFAKIIRRKMGDNKMKGIIKISIKEFDDNIIPVDIVEKITLFPNKNKQYPQYQINNTYIYYDNDIDITAYLDNLNENINEVIIRNYFGGEIKVKHIINIQGTEGETIKFLKNNIEKLFLMPFFKLFEINNLALQNEEKYNQLKEDNFGNQFDDLKILKPFEDQIKTINELLFFSRPDILGKSESKFIQEYITEKLNENQRNSLKEKLKKYYTQAIQVQNNQNINCLDSEMNSIAKECSFPIKINNISKKIKKLFMCERDCFKKNNFILNPLNDSFIKIFFMNQLITEVLKNIELDINSNKLNKSANEFKQYLNENIGRLYKSNIIPNVYFILIVILSSIESGDLIEFKDTNNIEKNYSSIEIEEMGMRKLFVKTKTKNIINSNISPKDSFRLNKNKIKDFSAYSSKQIIGNEYYNKFLQILNNYSNNLPEDIEISIYDNLKEENKNKNINLLAIIDMVNESINEEESKKGFLALIRQSYLLGKLRTNIVSIYFIILSIYRKKNILLVYLEKRNQVNQL